MKSKLEEFNELKNEFDILNNKRYFLSENPFYKVNEFIKKFSPELNKNYIKNVKTLDIINKHENIYDVDKNVISSLNNKADIFLLLYLASNDRCKKNSGLIDENGKGYGLNNGATDLFCHMISNKKLTYKVEALVAESLFMMDEKIFVASYFENNYINLKKINNDLDIDKLNEKLDKYHDNYLILIDKQKEKFIKSRFYNNLVYGNTLKQKNNKLLDLEKEIYNLEKENYEIVYDILIMLLNSLSNNYSLNKNNNLIIGKISQDFEKIVKSDNFEYLQELSKTYNNKIRIKKLK